MIGKAIEGGEKTILISKQDFADKALMTVGEIKELGIMKIQHVSLISTFLAMITYNLFDDDGDAYDE